jgi:AcrR family transcriptional regulator
MKGRGKWGVSRAQWLEAGLDALSDGGIHSVTIGGLAKSLGIARAGFYWHFRDRPELFQAMLDYWTSELTLVGTANVRIQDMTPIERLETIAEMVLEFDLGRYELSIRLWALHDKAAANAVHKVNRIRYDFVRAAFDELGFDGEELEMRSRLFFVYHSMEAQVQREIPKRQRRALIKRQLEFLTAEES